MLLKVSAIMDQNGHYTGSMAVWNIISNEERITNNVKNMAQIVAKTAEELKQTSNMLSAGAHETST